MSSFFNKSRDQFSSPSVPWVTEELLTILTSIPTNITPGKITDMIVTKWRDVVHELRPPKRGEPFLCTVQGCETYQNSKPVLRVSPPNSKQSLCLWLHESLIQFVGTAILAPGRQLRMISGELIHDTFMTPIRAVIVEMSLGRNSDYLWVKRTCQPNILSTLNSQSTVNAIMVKVVDKNPHCLFVKDDSVSDPIKLELTEKELDYASLLKIDDIVIIWRPDVNGDPVRLSFTDKTVIIRLPILHSEVTDPRDVCLCGIVNTISYSVRRGEWIGCQLDIIDRNDIRRTVVCPTSTSCEQKRVLASIRDGHFVYFFHLLASNGEDSVLKFTDGSTIYNMNCMVTLVESMVARPIPISKISFYLSGVVRAEIVEFEVILADIHIDCGCVISDLFCPKCGSEVEGRIKKEAVLRLTIDDGSLNLTAYGTSATVDFFVYDGNDWSSQLEFHKNKVIREKIGSEWVFFLSRCSRSEFGGKEDAMWRIDKVIRGRDETARTIRVLIGNLQSGEPYEIASCGRSMFNNPTYGRSDFLD